MKQPRTQIVRSPEYDIRVVGVTPTPLRDLYHALLRMRWSLTLLLIAVGFLAANAVFGSLYMVIGGVAHATPGSFSEAFFFSIQTMGTIGYGAMYPESLAANLVVVAESIVGLLLTALVTGLVFAKFSRSTARLVFARTAVISDVDGISTLIVRLGNARGNRIVEAQVRLTMVRTERSAAGKTFYRILDLKLTRDRIPSLARSWSLLHPIDADSPLHGQTAASLLTEEVELSVSLVGLDDTTMQTVHADWRYFARQILWNRRYVDVLSEAPDGALVLDLRRFHDTEPA